MNKRTKLAPFAIAGIVALSLGACASTGSDDTENAGAEARGPITFVQGKDNSNVIAPLIEKWNDAHPDEKVTFKELSATPGEQHDNYVQNLQAESSAYDVMTLDLVWTAEFAAKGWIEPLTGDLAVNTSELLSAPLQSGTYNDTLYALPMTSDAGILFYRTDLVPEPPQTWDEMMGMCAVAEEEGIACYAGQYANGEGLTVNVSEAIHTFGGSIVNSSGEPTLDTPEAEAGLRSLVEAYANGNIPKEAITYLNEEGRQSFQAGNLMFLRNWPYVYSLAKSDGSSTVKETFGVAPLPGVDGLGAASLGGHNTAINVYSENKATARDFMEYLISAESQTFFAMQGSLAPVLASVYDDPAVIDELPYLPVLKTAIENAVPRPVTPFYPAVTKAVQDNAYAAIQGSKSVEDALADMQSAILTAQAG